MAELARRRRNGFFRNRALLRIFSVILRWKIMKNKFLSISRWILDDFGPNGPFGLTAPKWLYSKLTILFRFFVILGRKTIKNMFFFITRWVWDYFGPCALIGPTAPKCMKVRFSIFVVILLLKMMMMMMFYCSIQQYFDSFDPSGLIEPPATK